MNWRIIGTCNGHPLLLNIFPLHLSERKLFFSPAAYWGAWGVVWGRGNSCPVDIDDGHERFTHPLCSIHGHTADELDGTCLGEDIHLFFDLGWLAVIILSPKRLRDFTWRLWRVMTNATDEDAQKRTRQRSFTASLWITCHEIRHHGPHLLASIFCSGCMVALHEFYIWRITQLPFVILKLAQTMAPRR